MSKILTGLAATTLVAAFTVSTEAEARGNARAASFSRPAAISRPAFAKPAFAKPAFAPRNFAPVRTASLPSRIGKPVVRNLSPRNPIVKPPRLVNAPGLGNPFQPGLGKLPPGLLKPPGLTLPPGLLKPPGLTLPPGLVGPPGIKPPKNPPVATPPPNIGTPTQPPVVVLPPSGTGGNSVSIDIGTGVGAALAAPAADCAYEYARWQTTGARSWKLRYYECTGQL